MINSKEIIEKIESVDLKSVDAIGNIESIIYTNFKKFPAIMTVLPVGTLFVRSRYLSDNEDFHHYIKDFSCRSDVDNIKIGRANLEKQSIFYVSRFRETSLKEVRFIHANREKELARYSTGLWEVKESMKVVAILSPELVKKHDSRELSDPIECLENFERQAGGDTELNMFIDLYNYVAKKYCEPVKEGEEYKYKITAAFSDYILSKVQDADGIIYQSVQNPKHYNVAFRKDVIVNRKLELKSAFRHTYAKKEESHFEQIESVESKHVNYENSLILWP